MKILKFILVSFLVVCFSLNAQNKLGKADDAGRIAICPIVGSIPDMPDAAERTLLQKMGQITTKNGMSSFGNRFIMYPHVTVMSQDITPTAPPMHAYNLDVTLFIADNITQNIFSSTTISLKGVGKNTTKAYIGALKMLNYKRPEVKSFVEEGKNKIIEYYNSKCDFILKDAESLAERKEYDEAIYTVVSIPDICKECYMKGQEVAVSIFKQMQENECMKNIADARTAKAQDDYLLAASYLSNILPDLNCYAEAQALLKEIEDHKCAIALGKAKGAWATRNSEDATKWLSEIPTDSKCSSEALALLKEIGDHQCAIALGKAKGAWASGNSRDAGRWLSEVPTDSKCSSEALALGEEIKAKLNADELRDWDFKMKVYEDDLAMKNRIQDDKMKIQDDNTEIEKARLKAMRDVGVAWGENQQPRNTEWINMD